MKTVRDVVEKAREAGYRGVADTIDLFADADDVFEIPPKEQPVDPETGLYLRSGVIWGREYVNEGTSDERTQDRRHFVEMLKQRQKRRLADAFEYCWARRDEVTNDDFDYTEIPLEPERTFVFSLGISFGIAYETTDKS